MASRPLRVETECARPLKVLRVLARLNIGGPARHAVVLDEGLRRRGFEGLLAYGSPEPGEGSLEDLAAERSIRRVHIRGLGRQIRPWRDLLALVQITRLMFDQCPDVVHTHTAKAGTLGRLAALAYNATRSRRRRCLVVHTFHGNVFSGYFGRSGSAAVRLVERLLAGVTDKIVTVSAHQRVDVAERFAIAPLIKTVVIPLGLDLQAFLALPGSCPESRRRWGFEGDEVVFGYVGRLVPVKDLDTLLVAFADAARSSATLRLLMIGDGELRPSLEARAHSLGLGTTVRFAGWQSDLPAVYSAVDAVVFSSLSEGTPAAAIEAMAAGLPVLATAVGGVPDLIDDERNGLLVPARDPARMTHAMLKLAASPALRQRLGAAARLDVRRRFGAERLVSDVAALYRDGLRVKRQTAG